MRTETQQSPQELRQCNNCKIEYLAPVWKKFYAYNFCPPCREAYYAKIEARKRECRREGNALGGSSKSPAKVEASRRNGKKGGRPIKRTWGRYYELRSRQFGIDHPEMRARYIQEYIRNCRRARCTPKLSAIQNLSQNTQNELGSKGAQ